MTSTCTHRGRAKRKPALRGIRRGLLLVNSLVTVFNADTLAETGSIDVASADGSYWGSSGAVTAVAPSPDATRVYAIVSASSSKYVAVIDTNPLSPTFNKQIGQIAVAYGAWTLPLAWTARAYVALADGKTVEVVDTATNSVLGYFTSPSSGV